MVINVNLVMPVVVGTLLLSLTVVTFLGLFTEEEWWWPLIALSVSGVSTFGNEKLASFVLNQGNPSAAAFLNMFSLFSALPLVVIGAVGLVVILIVAFDE